MRKLAILLLSILALSLGSATLAQDMPSTHCGDLAAADCTLLTDSATAMQSLKSATLDLNVQLGLKNIPNNPDVALGLTGNVDYAADSSALHTSLSSITDMQTLAQALPAIIKDVSADENLNLTLPPEAMAAIGDGSATGPINLQARLVDGVGYVNLDPLDAISGGQIAKSGMTGWVGLDLSGAAAQMMTMLQSLSSASASGSSAATPVSPTAAMNDLTQFVDLVATSKYFTVTRQADANGAAVFVTTIDVAGLMNDPQFQQDAFALAQARDATITQDQFNQKMSVFAIPGTTFTVTETRTIDLNTKYLQSSELVVAANVDMAQAAGSTASSPTMSQINLDGTVNYSNYDSAPAITAPEGATIIPLSSLFNGGASQ